MIKSTHFFYINSANSRTKTCVKSDRLIEICNLWLEILLRVIFVVENSSRHKSVLGQILEYKISLFFLIHNYAIVTFYVFKNNDNYSFREKNTSTWQLRTWGVKVVHFQSLHWTENEVFY